MAILTLSNIEKTFGQRVLFEGLSVSIDRGERVGLIGANGSGKTTLFGMITGTVVPDQGELAIASGIKLGYLSQDPTFTAGNTVLDEAELAFAQLHDLSHRMRELEHQMAEHTGDDLDRTLRRYETVQHDFDQAGGYAWRHRLEATLQGVGLPEPAWEQPVETLSGGQCSRLALAKLLIGEPDLLLLDEPTNHLDLAAIEWLEEYLLAFQGAVVLVSHDRYLLDRLATRIVWLTQQKLFSYPGNYSAFTVQRDHQELTQSRAHEQQRGQIEKEAEYIRRFKAGQRARQAKGREKRLDRLLVSDKIVSAVGHQKAIHIHFSTDQRAGDRVLDVRELSKSYEPRALWKDINFQVKRGERIGIIGPNGSGKTTLLRVLLGEADADGGDVRWGANLNIGYYDQRLDEFDPENSVMEEARGDRELTDLQVRSMLGALLFTGEDVHKPMSVLSGGERARVRLTQLLLDKPNVLLMDEPTNHLDIASRDALERTLGQFPGTILCVSHDRYLLDRLAKRLLVIEPPVITDFPGNYSAFAKRQAQRRAQKSVPIQNPKSKIQNRKSENSNLKSQISNRKSETPKRDNPYTRPFGRLTPIELEQRIAQTETALLACQQSLADPATFRDVKKCRIVQAEHDRLTAHLAELEAEYFGRTGG